MKSGGIGRESKFKPCNQTEFHKKPQPLYYSLNSSTNFIREQRQKWNGSQMNSWISSQTVGVGAYGVSGVSSATWPQATSGGSGPGGAFKCSLMARPLEYPNPKRPKL